jgi:hypothetical protein
MDRLPVGWPNQVLFPEENVLVIDFPFLSTGQSVAPMMAPTRISK